VSNRYKRPPTSRPILCRKCGQANMTLVKVDDGVYEHLNNYHCLMATSIDYAKQEEIRKEYERYVLRKRIREEVSKRT